MNSMTMKKSFLLTILMLSSIPALAAGNEQTPVWLTRPVENFAYHRHIPTLHTLAVHAAPADDLEQRAMPVVPREYAQNFQSDPEETDLKEAIIMELGTQEITQNVWYDAFRKFIRDARPYLVEHLLNHTELTQANLNDALCDADSFTQGNTINYLVKRGARGRFFDRWKDLPGHYAIVFSNSLEISKNLVNDFVSAYGQNHSPLSLAAAYDLKDVVEQLVPYTDHEVNLLTSFFAAARYGAYKSIPVLVEHMKKLAIAVHTQDDNGNAALHRAAHHNHPETIQTLVDCGADINPQDDSGRTPFFCAVEEGHYEAAERLANLGADITTPNYKVNTPLHLAAMKGKTNTLYLLLSRGVDINAGQESGNHTPLHLAVFSGKINTARMLIYRGANVNAKNKFNITPLHLAALKGHLAIVKLLLACGADINAQTKDYDTPLHDAVRGDPYGSINDNHLANENHLALVKFLARHGANINARDYLGQTPLALAYKDSDIENYLIEHGGVR